MDLDKMVLDKLDDLYIECKIKYYKHLKTAEYYKKMYTYMTIPIIVLSSLTTVLASLNSNLDNDTFAIVVAAVSGVTTIGHSVMSFLEYNTKYDIHFNCANKFINLARYIEKEFYTNFYNFKTEEEKEKFTINIIEYIEKELISIQGIEPYILSNIQKMSINDVRKDLSELEFGLFSHKVSDE